MPKRPRHDGDEEIINTSIRLPKPLLNRAKIQAIHDDVTLQCLIIEALVTELDRRELGRRSRDRVKANALSGRA
jgi:hypothetical protein